MVPANGPISGWLDGVGDGHSDAVAAAARAVAAQRRAEAVGAGFRDPTLEGSTGFSDGPGQAPHVTLPRVLPADALSAQVGIEAPVGAGLYGGAGVAERRLTATDDGSDRWQSIAGARLRLPLLRDRGYALTRYEEEQLAAEAVAVEAEARAVVAFLARDIVRAYAEWLQDVADAREVARAVDRAEKLLDETASRAALQVVAEYQVYPARFEAALRREELEAARQQIRTRLQTLAERLGKPEPPALAETDGDLLVRWAEALSGVDAGTLADARALRAECLVAKARAEAAQVAVAAASEALKGDLSLSAGASWENEATADGDAAEDSASDEPFGFEVAVTFRRPWGRDGERARVAAAQADADARLAELATVDVQIASQVARARTAFEGACARLALARGAVEEARRVLAAEDERFSLGEGSSRNVLDAQKDLTSATRRNVAVAGQVVTAMAELRYALGVPLHKATEQ